MTRLLMLRTPELHGPDVVHVQHRLSERLGAHGMQDGRYGPATAAAVRRFQRAERLKVDGIVGPDTLAALDVLGPVQPPEALMGREPPGLGALRWLVERTGMTEDPPGSNRCPITAEFGIGPGPWCCEAVSLAFKHGGGVILGQDVTPAPWGYWPGRGFSYCPALEAWARSRGYWIGHADPEPGDIALYAFGHSEAVHVGIVRQRLSAFAFLSTEGNTSPGSSVNGGTIATQPRHTKDVRGFVRITWGHP